MIASSRAHGGPFMPMFKERALSRKEKEELYVRKFTELQTMWRNPIGPSDPEYQRDPSGYWNFVKEWDDKQLDESIRNATEQIKFERGWSGCASVINFIVVAFVVLGVTGLLVFGVKQLIALFR